MVEPRNLIQSESVYTRLQIYPGLSRFSKFNQQKGDSKNCETQRNKQKEKKAIEGHSCNKGVCNMSAVQKGQNNKEGATEGISRSQHTDMHASGGGNRKGKVHPQLQ